MLANVYNRGRSVTNAVTDLRRAMLAVLKDAQPSPAERARAALLTPHADVGIDVAIAAFAATYEHSVAGLLGVALKTLRTGARVLLEERDAARRLANVTWVEHYPNGTVPSLFSYDKHALVTFDPMSGRPMWEHVNVRVVAERTGYSVRQLSIPKDRLVKS